MGQGRFVHCIFYRDGSDGSVLFPKPKDATGGIAVVVDAPCADQPMACPLLVPGRETHFSIDTKEKIMKTGLLRSALYTTSAAVLVTVGGVVPFAGLAYAESEPYSAPHVLEREKSQERAGGMIDDTLITTKVKAAFVRDETVSALRIGVTSNNGIVQLSGFANSPQEAERAAMVASQIPGVKEVENDIQVKSPAERW
jgi:hypothetical protein